MGAFSLRWDGVIEDAVVVAGREACAPTGALAETFSWQRREEARERACAVSGRNYLPCQLSHRLGSGLIQATKIDLNMSDDDPAVYYMMDNIWIASDPGDCRWERDCLRLIAEEVAPCVSDPTG